MSAVGECRSRRVYAGGRGIEREIKKVVNDRIRDDEGKEERSIKKSETHIINNS